MKKFFIQDTWYGKVTSVTIEDLERLFYLYPCRYRVLCEDK